MPWKLLQAGRRELTDVRQSLLPQEPQAPLDGLGAVYVMLVPSLHCLSE